MTNLKSAVTAANYIKAFHFPAHRGVFEIDLGFIVFGNDGYSQSERAKMEVKIVRERLKALDLPEPAFGVDEANGYSWALVYFPVTLFHKSPPQFRNLLVRADEIVWEAWKVACAESHDEQGLADVNGA